MFPAWDLLVFLILFYISENQLGVQKKPWDQAPETKAEHTKTHE